MIEPDGERTFLTVTGADAIVEVGSLDDLEYREGDAVYVSGYDLAYPASGDAVATHVAGLRKDLFVVFDPGPLVGDILPNRLQRVIGRADLVSLNERENQALGQIETATVVVRHGADGATLYRSGQRPVHIEAVRLENVVDTSGAGDVHVGANLAGLAAGMSWRDAVLLANRAAAYAVSRPGPASGPTTAELESFGAGRW
jgi:sugar/nucleoside kinase (ribokinase family)